MSNYRKKALVEIEVWVSSRKELEKVFGPLAHEIDINEKKYPWRGSILHSNGSMEWQWCKSFDEAVQWCESFIKN